MILKKKMIPSLKTRTNLTADHSPTCTYVQSSTTTNAVLTNIWRKKINSLYEKLWNQIHIFIQILASFDCQSFAYLYLCWKFYDNKCGPDEDELILLFGNKVISIFNIRTALPANHSPSFTYVKTSSTQATMGQNKTFWYTFL